MLVLEDISAVNMVQNLVKTPLQILRGRSSLKFCFCFKVSCLNLEEFRSHLMAGKVITFQHTRSHQNSCRKKADDHSILNFDKKAAYFAYCEMNGLTQGTRFFVIQQHSALTCFSVRGLFFRLKCNALWPPFSPPCFPLLVARKVSYCPSMYDDGLVAVNACEHSVISSNMASSVQNTKSLEYVILYGEHRIFYDLKKTFPMHKLKYSYLSL